MVEELIPIALFAAIALIFFIVLYFKQRSRAEMQQTIRLALEKGNELTPEIISQLGEPEPSKNRDLRRALIWLALAVGLALCGFFVPAPFFPVSLFRSLPQACMPVCEQQRVRIAHPCFDQA